LAKLSSDKVELTFEDLDLKAEVENTISINKVLFDEHHITVENNINDQYMVEADRLRLSEVLNNLVTNAVKYSNEEGGQIIFNAEEQEEDILISIRDTGIGMTEEQISHIFDEFYKADESRHNLDSSGLGLAITKKIIKKHNGKIWAESSGPKQGTTFFFTLKKPEMIQLKRGEQEITE
jgi:signal transduction histidine kinase